MVCTKVTCYCFNQVKCEIPSIVAKWGNIIEVTTDLETYFPTTLYECKRNIIASSTV